jgi:hypothetical protein
VQVGDRSMGQVAADLDWIEKALQVWVERVDIGAGTGYSVPPVKPSTAGATRLLHALARMAGRDGIRVSLV